MKSKHKRNHRSLLPQLLTVLVAMSIFAAGIVAWYFTDTQNVSIFEVGSANQVSLSLSPTATTNSNLSLNINLNTATKKVSAVVLDLSYDSTQLKLLNLQPTSLLPTILAPLTIKDNHALLTLATTIDTKDEDKSGTIATLTFEILRPGSSAIQFGEDTMVAAADFDESVLELTSNYTLDISSPSNAPTTPSIAPKATAPVLATTTPSSYPTTQSPDQSEDQPNDFAIPQSSTDEQSYASDLPLQTESQNLSSSPNILKQFILGWQIIFTKIADALQ